MSKLFLSGNEAIARGAYDVASAYPGTPSTEILENIAKFKGEINSEWSVNEKVAMEIGIGASIAGARALVCMKHVGLNVAMDPLMTYTFEGTNGGLVVVSADDPGMHSSQNEQDNRVLQRFARAVTLEPSDSQEAFDMARAAWDLSERTGSIVFLRMTTRTSHSSSLVDVGDGARGAVEPKPYVKNPKKYVSVPANARAMRFEVEKRLEVLRQESEASPFNRAEPGERTDFGFVASAAAYNYVKEAFPEFPVFKVGFSNPLPAEKIRAFAAKVGALVVVEELDPVLRDAIVLAGIPVRDYATELRMMELNVDRLRALRRELLGEEGAAPAPEKPALPALPARPPTLCAGCGHRGVFYTLAKLKATVTGDIGCYTLGVAPPLSSMDTTICMGASIGAAFGMRKAGYKGRLAAVIGDSTFFHSGMTGLLDGQPHHRHDRPPAEPRHGPHAPGRAHGADEHRGGRPRARREARPRGGRLQPRGGRARPQGGTRLRRALGRRRLRLLRHRREEGGRRDPARGRPGQVQVLRRVLQARLPGDRPRRGDGPRPLPLEDRAGRVHRLRRLRAGLPVQGDRINNAKCIMHNAQCAMLNDL